MAVYYKNRHTEHCSCRACTSNSAYKKRLAGGWKTLKSKYDGTCNECQKPFQVGDPIWWEIQSRTVRCSGCGPVKKNIGTTSAEAGKEMRQAVAAYREAELQKGPPGGEPSPAPAYKRFGTVTGT